MEKELVVEEIEGKRGSRYPWHLALLYSSLYLSRLAHGGRVQSLSPGDRGGKVASFVQKLWLNHNQSYGFSKSHVWMCKLDHKES